MRKTLALSIAVISLCCAGEVFAQDAESQDNSVVADSNETVTSNEAKPAADKEDSAPAAAATVAAKEDSAGSSEVKQVPPPQPWSVPMGDQVIASHAVIPPVENVELSAADKALNYITDRFRFGSYGRVQPSMDPEDNSSGRQPSIVSAKPRVDEGSYVELTLGYTPYRDEDGTVVEVVTTLALDGSKLFHYDGDWDASLAIRNLYVEARNLWIDGLTVWAGSRMYRGDDIYLLDFWPLDNLNTYGGGIGWHGSTRTNIDLHFGTNRLNKDYQYEVVSVENVGSIGDKQVVYLDRQRFIASLKAEQQWGEADKIQFKAKAYVELQSIGKGEYIETQPELITTLPKDFGWLIGAEFGMWNFYNDSFLNVFIKYAEGLAAYGEMTVPYGVNTALEARDAKSFLFGLSSGFDFKYVDVLAAGYVRYFADADGIEEDYDDGVEGVWDIRVTGHVGKYFAPGLELSQQLRRANGLNPETLSQDTASIFKFSLLPAVRFGEGILARPEIRFNYTLSVLNDAARNSFPKEDHLRGSKYEHFLGIAAEWWFNI